MSNHADIKTLLKRPYMRTVVPQEDGSYHAEIVEFPGCMATGETAAQALQTLEGVAESWLAAVLDAGQQVPLPLESNDYSGKLVLRMPRGLHRKAALLAEREGVSLNQLIATCLAERVGSARPEASAKAPGVFAEVAFAKRLEAENLRSAEDFLAHFSRSLADSVLTSTGTSGQVPSVEVLVTKSAPLPRFWVKRAPSVDQLAAIGPSQSTRESTH
jgi:predicted RNase H-like HicB family nuclease